MANFSTHLYGAAVVSSAAALGLHSAGLADTTQAQTYFAIGVIGGLLPDIDADSSRPVRAFFSFTGALAAFLVCFALVDRFPVVELALIWSLVYLTVRYGVFEVFIRFTVHRGIWHSWLAMLFVALATANLAYWALGLPAWDAWVCAGFVAIGYLTHLCLDEIASVDLLNSRVKRSFGTAMKPFSLRSPGASLAMAAAAALLLFSAPSLMPVIEAGRSLDEAWASRVERPQRPSSWFAGWPTALGVPVVGEP
ncbi:metal-dependent hydrolase [Thioalkalicoccus limnaeus]|uniref:Metal-dependent hydrolase n=1 Tax=Thioalkalicoccus limnaeus TaxID=120681 RepID=A0ABV4BB99_9GAMM